MHARSFAFSATALGLAITLTAPLAFAGDVIHSNVVATTGYFAGSIGNARYAADTHQDIGCLFESNTELFCWAYDATGAYKSCFWFPAAGDPTDLNGIAGKMSTDSYLQVWFNTSGRCTQMQVENGSEQIY